MYKINILKKAQSDLGSHLVHPFGVGLGIFVPLGVVDRILHDNAMGGKDMAIIGNLLDVEIVSCIPRTSEFRFQWKEPIQ